jgi:hypothetical protein
MTMRYSILENYMKSLLEFRTNITSYNGEDGILAEIFKHIGVENKWCVEFGARDGVIASNTYTLMEHEGWSSIQIESNHFEAHNLRKNTAKYPNVEALELLVTAAGPHSLDEIFKARKIPKEFDLLVIDIDSYDYQIWNSLTYYKPRVVMIEYNENLPITMDWIQKDTGPDTGSSLKSIQTLGKSKDYTLVYAQDCNAIFIDTEVVKKTSFVTNPSDFDNSQAETTRSGRFIQAFDGTFILIPDHEPSFLKELSRIQKYPTSQVYLLNKKTDVIEAVISTRENKFMRKLKDGLKNSWVGVVVHPLALKFYSFIASKN